MRAVVALAIKDIRLLVRDRLGAFFTFLFPILYALLFGLMFSGAAAGPSSVPVVVVDLDGSPGSARFVASLERSGSIVVEQAESEAASRELVRRGKAAAAVVLEPGFGDPAASILTGGQPRIHGVADPSRQAETAVVRGVLHGAIVDRLFEAMRDPASVEGVPEPTRRVLASLGAVLGPSLAGGATGEAGAGPIRINLEDLTSQERRAPASAFALTFAQGAAWGLMACTLGSSLSLVGERSSGTLARLEMSPVHQWQILAGKALACFVTGMFMLTVLAAFVHLPFFGVRVASYLLLLLAMACSCTAFVGVMMVIAITGRTVAAVEGFGRAVLLVLALAGGAAVPVVFMPDWMRSIAGLSPFRWVIDAIDGAVWRGLDVDAMLVPCGILVGIGLVGFLAGSAVFQRLPRSGRV
ncbi:MAG: ABC transporter permease [Planctomycetota bacterium]